jgi:hypothetical protein
VPEKPRRHWHETYMRLNVLLVSADFSAGKSWTKRPKRTWRTRELLFRTPRCMGHAGARMREADHGGAGSQLSQRRHHKDAVVMRSTPLVLPVGGYHSILRQHLGQCWQHIGTSQCAASPVLAKGNAAKAAHTILERKRIRVAWYPQYAAHLETSVVASEAELHAPCHHRHGHPYLRWRE